MYAMLGDLSVV